MHFLSVNNIFSQILFFYPFPFLQAVDLGPAIFTHAFGHIDISIAFGAFDHVDPAVQGHDSVVVAEGEGILLICGCDPPTSQIHQSDLQLHIHAQYAVLHMLLQPGIVHNVVINDIRPGIVASAGFVVQVIIEPLFVDAGGGPELLLPTVLFFFVSSDRPQYRISIAQVEKVIEDHSQDCAVDENLAHIIAIEGPGGIYDPQAA
jgi:hypothetical protein